jgi:acyl-CoA thioesterase FadM
MPMDEDVDCATGSRVMVRVDPQTRRPVPWTAKFREQIEPFLRKG